jgi:hypothetical protein
MGVKISTLTGVWKKLIPPLVDNLEGFKNSVEKVTADVVETARELYLEVEPEVVTELLPSHDNSLTDELLLMDEQRNWFLEMESTLGEEAVNVVEIATKDLEYYMNSVDKAASGFERTDSSSERSSVVGTMLSNSIVCYREIFRESKIQSIGQTSLLPYFKNCPSYHNLQQPPS